MNGGRWVLPPHTTDIRLWPGAFAEGWRVREATAGTVLWDRSGCNPPGGVQGTPSEWSHVAPDGVTKFQTVRQARRAKTAALKASLKAEAQEVVEVQVARRAETRDGSPARGAERGGRGVAMSSPRTPSPQRKYWSAQVVWSAGMKQTIAFERANLRFRARLQISAGWAGVREGGGSTALLPPETIRILKEVCALRWAAALGGCSGRLRLATCALRCPLSCPLGHLVYRP